MEMKEETASVESKTRRGYRELSKKLFGDERQVQTAKKLVDVDPALKAIVTRWSSKLVTFEDDDIEAYKQSKKGQGIVVQSIRGAFEKLTDEKRKAQVDPKIVARSECARTKARAGASKPARTSRRSAA
jgi:anti-sigma-K factor RskA